VDSGRFLIAHKDPLARGYLRLIVERHFHFAACAEVDSFDALLARLRENGLIKLTVVDLDLPGMSREVGLRYLALHHRGTRIAVLIGRLTPDTLELLAETGVAALVPKRASEASLGGTLRRVVRATSFVTFAADESSSREEGQVQRSLPQHGLTDRQREVLRLLSLGYSNREIGRQLGIAEGTVKAHVNAAFKVLGVHNRVSAAAALRLLFEGAGTPLQGDA
jgi:DNA-binding NarL/FixJ family response regulator